MNPVFHTKRKAWNNPHSFATVLPASKPQNSSISSEQYIEDPLGTSLWEIGTKGGVL
jgi:hypothetical protein